MVWTKEKGEQRKTSQQNRGREDARVRELQKSCESQKEMIDNIKRLTAQNTWSQKVQKT
jgi:hypothetical protein